MADHSTDPVFPASDPKSPVPPITGPPDPPEKEEAQPEPPPFGPVGRGILLSLIVVLMVTAGFVVYAWVRDSRLVNRLVRNGPLSTATNFYSAPRGIAPGDPGTVAGLVSDLRAAGYSETSGDRLGRYRVNGDTVQIESGPDSYFQPVPCAISFSNGKVSSIRALKDGSHLDTYRLEPQVLANVAKGDLQKRQVLQFGDIPKVLVDAVISAEDKHFFQHSGFDAARILKAAWVDLRTGRKEQGASTLSMQLARNLFLSANKSFRRKASELCLSMQLEHSLSKQQIFETYANQVYLGRSGTYSIHGFGESAQVLFGSDIRKLTLPQAALLAGLIQRPSYYDPLKHPHRASERRNVVLALMRDNGYINPEQFRQAAAAPLELAGRPTEVSEAPYFLDYVADRLDDVTQGSTPEGDIFTTLDLNLQRAANEAVRIGMRQLDRRYRKPLRDPKTGIREPQVALIALDPHTGEIKAMVGGRDYHETQLNRALAQRQPGSVFKPFVYAAAIDTAVNGGAQVFTAASTIDDVPTTFQYGGQEYSPGNFHQEFLGNITLRRALALSANNATVKLASMVGYSRVAGLARRAGLGEGLHATPSMALGSYEATPLEMAQAYTMFANEGTVVTPDAIDQVRERDGTSLYTRTVNRLPALDPRVAYVMVSMMQEVMRSGTGAGARSRGFTQIAAGKTGTSRDAWFAGFTPELLAIVWVGIDDNSDLGFTGAAAALPVWTEFMKRAAQFAPYRQAGTFPRPAGILDVAIDPDSGCPSETGQTVAFVAGTEPGECQPELPYSAERQQTGQELTGADWYDLDIPRKTTAIAPPLPTQSSAAPGN